MNKNGRPDHIEDYLITVRTGQWFGWSDDTDKVYANLVVLDAGAKPSESDCTTGLSNLQTAWDLQNNSYKSNRRAEYPQLAEQFDLLYKDIVAGTVTTSGDFATAIKAVKDKYSKE